MALPEGFNEFEFLQDLMRKWQNRIVREDFQDLGGDDWNPDVSIPRGALRHAFTHKDDDTSTMDLMRLFLYYFVYRKAADLQPPIYGIPKAVFDSYVTYRPQIKLYFCQRSSELEANEHPAEGEISFRLMSETSETLTMSELKRYGQRIGNIFGRGGGYDWHKGYYKYTYFDKQRGYEFRILAYSEIVAKELIERVLEIQEHTPQWEFFNSVTNEKPAERFPANPGTVKILNKTYKKARRRPRVHVRFRYASVSVHGLPNDITLFDLTGVKTHALVG